MCIAFEKNGHVCERFCFPYMGSYFLCSATTIGNKVFVNVWIYIYKIVVTGTVSSLWYKTIHLAVGLHTWLHKIYVIFGQHEYSFL
jgi:hypothetical protein